MKPVAALRALANVPDGLCVGAGITLRNGQVIREELQCNHRFALVARDKPLALSAADGQAIGAIGIAEWD